MHYSYLAKPLLTYPNGYGSALDRRTPPLGAVGLVEPQPTCVSEVVGDRQPLGVKISRIADPIDMNDSNIATVDVFS